jgi:hypothetical protein
MPNHCVCGHHYQAHDTNGGACLARENRKKCECWQFRPRPASDGVFHEPPCSLLGTPFVAGQETQLGPGVIGWAFKDGERVVIPLLAAQREGAGDVGRFLDSLSPRCCIVGVMNDRLRGMLIRRNWRVSAEPYDGEIVDTWRHTV